MGEGLGVKVERSRGYGNDVANPLMKDLGKLVCSSNISRGYRVLSNSEELVHTRVTRDRFN